MYFLAQQRAFQHTATRRWLPLIAYNGKHEQIVSTHSHPKVAAALNKVSRSISSGFNTQPPEGGCSPINLLHIGCLAFQHTATRRWLPFSITFSTNTSKGFNTQPPEGGCMFEISSFVNSNLFQHTATRRWLHPSCASVLSDDQFQHTATRRWLPLVV